MVRWCEAVEGEYEGERNAAGEMEGHGTMVCVRQRLYRWRVQGCGQREAVEGRGIYRYPSGTVCTTASGRPARWTGAARTFLPRRRFGRIHASLLLLLFNTFNAHGPRPARLCAIRERDRAIQNFWLAWAAGPNPYAQHAHAQA